MSDFFKTHPKAIVGMVHCLPLPGTVNFKDNLDEVRAQALQDAITLSKAGVDAIMIENMGDEPYGITMELEQTVALAAIAEMIKKEVPLPLGIDCAFSDYKSSLAIAKAVGAEFVRIPVYVDTVIYGNGIIKPSARDAQLYRRKINGEHIKIMADLQVKHTYMLNSSITLLDSLHLAEAAFADAVVITGSITGSATSIDDLIMIKKHAKVPVYVGSGVKVGNVKEQLEYADGVIVGSSLKPNGAISKPVDLQLTKQLVEAAKSQKGK